MLTPKPAEAREVFLSETPPPTEEQQPSAVLFASVALASFSPLLFGMSLAFTSPAEGGLKTGPQSVMSQAQFPTYVSFINVGCIAGAFLGQALNEKLGRKGTLVFTALPHLLAWVGTAMFDSYVMLFSFRIIAGLAVGIGSAVAPVYLGEVATTELRGVIGTVHQFSVTVGILLTNLVGDYVFVEQDGSSSSCQWKTLSLFTACLSAVLLMCLWIPESPSFLAKKGDVEGMQKALKRLRKGDCSAEAAALMSANGPNTSDAAAQQQSGGSLSDYRKSLVIGVGLMLFQQFSGINAIMMYTAKICKDAAGASGGDATATASMAAVLVMLAQVVFTGVAAVLMDRAGRRPLLLTGVSFMVIGHLGLVLYYFGGVSSIIAFMGLGTVIIGFSLSLGPIPWLIVSEIVPVSVRGAAAAIFTATSWFSSFVVTLAFEPMDDAIGHKATFGACALVCVGCLVFTLVLVPETKGKTVEEVLEILEGVSGPQTSGQRRISLQTVA